VATHEDSRPSIGELWLDINKLDDPPCEDTSVVHARNALIHRKRSAASIGNISKCSRCDGNKDSLADVAGMSSIRTKQRKGGSTRREAAWILSDAPGAISPRMRRSFVDRRYSHLTGMVLVNGRLFEMNLFVWVIM
jgi:hypothetical protein